MPSAWRWGSRWSYRRGRRRWSLRRRARSERESGRGPDPWAAGPIGWDWTKFGFRRRRLRTRAWAFPAWGARLLWAQRRPPAAWSQGLRFWELPAWGLRAWAFRFSEPRFWGDRPRRP